MSLEDYADVSGGFRTMSLAEFHKISHDIQAGGKLKVLRFYFMGEPLLNPHLPEMIQISCRMRLSERTELTTNGALLDEEKSLAIINSGLDYLRISISSVDQSRHENVTQSNAKVGHIYENIRQFRQIRDKMGRKRPFLYVKMLDSLDDSENSRFLTMYQEVADEMVIEKPMNWNNFGDHDLLAATYGGKQAGDPAELYPYGKTVCPFPFYTLMVNVNGDVTVCCVDWNKGIRVGNVFESSLQSIWNGQEMRALRQMHILGKRKENRSCANCQFLYTVPDNLDNMSDSMIMALIGPH